MQLLITVAGISIVASVIAFKQISDSSVSPYIPLIVAGIAAIVALAAHHIINKTKISEFRQAWINDLRSDIADFVGAADLWMKSYERFNDSNDKLKKEKLYVEMEKLSNAAFVILWRIRLRINPRNNQNKLYDDKFLSQLLDLLDPGKIGPVNPASDWRRIADEAVETGRELLKREWQTTKGTPDQTSTWPNR